MRKILTPPKKLHFSQYKNTCLFTQICKLLKGNFFYVYVFFKFQIAIVLVYWVIITNDTSLDDCSFWKEMDLLFGTWGGRLTSSIFAQKYVLNCLKQSYPVLVREQDNGFWSDDQITSLAHLHSLVALLDKLEPKNPVTFTFSSTNLKKYKKYFLPYCFLFPTVVNTTSATDIM